MEKGRIIIVEDEQNILGVLDELLTAKGYSVDPFLDAKGALIALRNNSYQLLITDLDDAEGRRTPVDKFHPEGISEHPRDRYHGLREP